MGRHDDRQVFVSTYCWYQSSSTLVHYPTPVDEGTSTRIAGIYGGRRRYPID